MSSIDVSLLPKNVPSLCIPRVFPNITKDRIFNSFKDINIGYIEQIDTIVCTDKSGQKYQRVFVHLQWNNAAHSIQMRQRALEGKEVKIVYDEPWFWKVSANRATKATQTRPQTRPQERTRPSLEKARSDSSDVEEEMRTKKADNDRRRNPLMSAKFRNKQEQEVSKQSTTLKASDASAFTKVEAKK
jgi:hypothetical protein